MNFCLKSTKELKMSKSDKKIWAIWKILSSCVDMLLFPNLISQNKYITKKIQKAFHPQKS